MKQKVGIIGSGLSGLSAAWMLVQDGRFDVTIFEKHPRLGMDAASIDVELNMPNNKKQMARIDVPLRVFCPKYYPNLIELYKMLDVPIITANYCTTNLSSPNTDINHTHFIYKNIKLWKFVTIPYVSSFSFVKLGYEWLYFLYRSPFDLSRESTANQTILQYLEKNNYSEVFIHKVLLPSLAGMCTCKVSSVSEYPAPIIIDYLAKLAVHGVARSLNGTQQVVATLSKDCNLQLDCNVQAIEPLAGQNKVQVTADGKKHIFDHVIVSTQADIACNLLKRHGTKKQLEALSCFPYESSQTILHRDISLMPKDRKDWSGINFFVDNSKPMPMASIWMNKVQPALNPKVGCMQTEDPHYDEEGPLIQTWAPFHQPKPEKTIRDVWFTRPVITFKAVEGMKLLEKVQGENNIYFSGSYALYAVPLLESAIISGFSIAEKLGCKRPFLLPEGSAQVEFNPSNHGTSLLSVFFVRFFIVFVILYLMMM